MVIINLHVAPSISCTPFKYYQTILGRQKKGKKSVYEKTTPALLTEDDFDKDHQTLLEACRITPQYTITYQQAVSSEDVFLQVNKFFN